MNGQMVLTLAMQGRLHAEPTAAQTSPPSTRHHPNWRPSKLAIFPKCETNHERVQDDAYRKREEVHTKRRGVRGESSSAMSGSELRDPTSRFAQHST